MRTGRTGEEGSASARCGGASPAVPAKGARPAAGLAADPYLSVVVPAYNEEAFVGRCVEGICAYLDSRKRPYEVLVVDDGSADRTSGEAAAAGASRPGRVRVLRREANFGKGSAVQQGVHHARGARILMCDADLSTPIEEVEKLESALDEGCGVAFGSRSVPGAQVEVRQPLHREWMGRIFNALARSVVLPGVRDTQCGFKLFTREAAERVFPLQTIGGFCFDLEILYLARRAGVGMREIPVRWINRTDTRVSLLRDPLEMALDVFRIRLRRRRDPTWHLARLDRENAREIAVPAGTGPGTSS